MASFQTNKPTHGDESERSERNFGVHNTSAFSTDMAFKSRQDLLDWVQKVGRSLGYVIVTKRSKTLPSGVTTKVFLMCDRGGIPRSKSSIRNRGSKKINCPFELVGKYWKMYDVWTLVVICGKHNHEPSLHIKDHPYAMRLSDSETRLVFDLSRKNMKPQDILSTLKEQNKNNVSSIKTIYNACHKFRKTQHAETFTRQGVNSDERASPSLVDTVYTFDANKLKRTIDHTDPLAVRKSAQELNTAKLGPGTKNMEDLFPKKLTLMPSFTRVHSLQADIMETNHVKDVSIANPVREDAVMYYDGNYHVTNAREADDEHASARPFQPYQEVVLNKPKGQFLTKQFLDGDYESQTNTAVESTDKEDKKVDNDTEIEIQHDKGEYVRIQSSSDIEEDYSQYDSNQMASFLTTKSTQGGENERNLGVHNKSAFSTDMAFKSRQDLFDWVQNVGRSLGYVIVTKRSKTLPSGVTTKVFLMCDRGGIYKCKSSIRNRGTKKTNCPFKLAGKYWKTYDVWTLTVICEKHNHEPSLHMKDHPYAMRMSTYETRLVSDLSRKNVKPQAILSILKEQNKNNMSTLRTIYNARQKFRRTQHEETFTRQVVNSDERASSNLLNTVYTFDANKLKETIGQTDPFAIRNLVQELILPKYGSSTKDIEDLLLPRKQILMASFTRVHSIQADLVETNHVKDVECTNQEDKKVDSDAEVEITHDKGEYVGVQSDKDDSQYDVNFDGLTDIWKEMTVGLESSKGADMDPSINQHAKTDEEECDHSFILKEDIGYVCGVCGVVKRAIESIIEFQRPKSSKSTKTYYNGDQSDKSGEPSGAVLDGVKSQRKDFSVGELPGHVDFSVFLNLSPRQKGEVFELKNLARKFKISSDGSAIYVHPDLKSFVKTSQEKNDDDAINIDQILEKSDERVGVKAKFFLNLLHLCTLTGEKLLVFGQYLLPLKFLLRLTMKVKGWSLNKEIFMITGDHNNEEREVAMDQFNNSSDAKVFFGSINACGEGISLIGASRIIILDVHLNPSVTRQAIGGAFRPGQVRKVYTYRLVAAGSHEEEDHTTCFRKDSIAKLWFEYNEYCGQNEFEMEKIDIKDCGDQFLETPWLSEDVTALYKRLVKLPLFGSAKIGGLSNGS